MRQEVRNDYLIPNMGMGAFSPKAKLSDRIFTQEHFTTPWCILILHQISGFTAKPWSFYDIVSMVFANLNLRFVFYAKNDTKNLTERSPSETENLPWNIGEK